VFGNGVTFADQDNVSKVVGVCGKDVHTVIQALSKQVEDVKVKLSV
jgi:hypothetical protein